MGLHPHTTIEQAKTWLRARLDDGAPCPVCTQLAKVYRRKIHAGMAAVLIRMYARGRTGWVYLPDVPQKSRDATGLAFWGLIEEQRTVLPKDEAKTGWWRVTPFGEAFLRGQVTVQKYALIYDGRLMTREGEEVTIRACLGTKFDYDELMAGV